MTDDQHVFIHQMISCDAGEDCKSWREGNKCAYPGTIKIGGKRVRCLSFEQDMKYHRQSLEGQILKRRGGVSK